MFFSYLKIMKNGKLRPFDKYKLRKIAVIVMPIKLYFIPQVVLGFYSER
jgi:hypothetical protein